MKNKRFKEITGEEIIGGMPTICNTCGASYGQGGHECGGPPPKEQEEIGEDPCENPDDCWGGGILCC